MPLPVIYKRATEGVIASYSHTDLAEGTGVIVYYGANTVDNAVNSYVLSTVPTYSNDKITLGGGAGNGDTLRVDADFDVNFNLPQNIKGKLTAQVSWIQGMTDTAGQSGTSYVILKVRKWDGTTETEIATNTKSDTLTPANLEADGKTVNIEVNIASTQHFKSGEALRITVQLWNSTTGRIALCHDPKNRIVTGAEYGSNIDLAPDTTQLIINVPFRLDL